MASGNQRRPQSFQIRGGAFAAAAQDSPFVNEHLEINDEHDLEDGDDESMLIVSPTLATTFLCGSTFV